MVQQVIFYVLFLTIHFFRFTPNTEKIQKNMIVTGIHPTIIGLSPAYSLVIFKYISYIL